MYIFVCAGAQDYRCAVESDLIRDAKDAYSYSGELLFDNTFKDFADSVCKEFELHYPPLSHEDALFLYFIITDECRRFSL